MSALRDRPKKKFFFEKKNQKTFVCLLLWRRAADRGGGPGEEAATNLEQSTEFRMILTMQPEKNLQAAVPPALLTQLEQAAMRERVTVDAFVADAIEHRVNQRAFEETLAFGKRHAKSRGLTQGDVAKAIAEVRSGSRGHER